MITVSISINGEPIYARTAVNVTQKPTEFGPNLYRLDDGRLITHERQSGAVKLAIEMLKTIKEPKRD